MPFERMTPTATPMPIVIGTERRYLGWKVPPTRTGHVTRKIGPAIKAVKMQTMRPCSATLSPALTTAAYGAPTASCTEPHATTMKAMHSVSRGAGKERNSQASACRAAGSFEWCSLSDVIDFRFFRVRGVSEPEMSCSTIAPGRSLVPGQGPSYHRTRHFGIHARGAGFQYLKTSP